jgi:hypothetical protein
MRPDGKPSAQDEKLISEVAATRAASDVQHELEESGWTRVQAQAMSRAFQEYLLRDPGYRQRAESLLINAGISRERIDQLLGELEARTAA